MYAIYAVALAVSISIWFAAFRAPLFLDETGTFWTISAGFSHIWSRQCLNFPAYDYILWAFTRIFGTSEAALRAPSLLAMLGAAWLMYKIARELFERDTAVLATILFCIHPIIVFASINVRPYAFGALAVTAAIYTLLRLRRSRSMKLAALFGFLSACVLYSHYLFAGLLPALLIGFFLFKKSDRRTMWRQLGVALAVFVLACLPMVPGVLFMLRTSGAHVSVPAPNLADLIWTFAPGFIPFVIGGVVLLAGVVSAKRPRTATTPAPDSIAASQPAPASAPNSRSEIWFCILLAVLPLLLLYVISVTTPIHMFEQRHRLAAVPGIALCWALVIRRYLTPGLRVVLCLALLVAIVYRYDISSFRNRRVVTWKYAIQTAETIAAPDNAPVVICSSFPESNYSPMPIGAVKTSQLFPQLSYYKLTVPVVPLPRALNAEAIRLGAQFLAQAAEKRERFLAMADKPSYPTLDWLAKQATAAYQVRDLGIFGETKVLEFIPRQPVASPPARAAASPSPSLRNAALRPAASRP